MSQQQDGGANPADKNLAQDGADGKQQDGGNDITKQFEALKAELETLKKESSGKDRKIAEFLKEKENFALSTKTKDEQLEHYKAMSDAYERKESFRQAFKDIGLNPDEFMEIVDEKDAKTQAEKFAKLLKSRVDESAKSALEKFKEDELKKKGGVPKPKDNKLKTNSDINAAIRGALGR